MSALCMYDACIQSLARIKEDTHTFSAQALGNVLCAPNMTHTQVETLTHTYFWA
jgi:hypothetical protein